MKRSQQSAYCSRCGDELSPDEMLQLDGSICAFCDNIRSEALEMQASRLKLVKPDAARSILIPTKNIRHSGHLKPHRPAH